MVCYVVYDIIRAYVVNIGCCVYGDVVVVSYLLYIYIYIYINGCDLVCRSVFLYSVLQQLTYLPSSTVTSLPCRRLAGSLPVRLTSGSLLGWLRYLFSVRPRQTSRRMWTNFYRVILRARRALCHY